MPISSPAPDRRSTQSSSARCTKNRCLFLAPLLILPLFSACASAQMLAKPGLPGPGVNNEPWWKHAVFYQVAGPADATDFKALTVRLDSLHALGVDALLLPAPALPSPGSNSAMPNLDDLDNLLRQAGSHSIRVLLTIQTSGSPANLSGVARFWLTRGVAGLHVVTPAGTTPEETQAAVQAIRKLESNEAGQRIVISDLDLASSAITTDGPSIHRVAANRASKTVSSATAQLQIDTRAESLQPLSAAGLRPLMDQAIAQPSLLLALHAPSSPADSAPLADAVAAIAVLSRTDVLIDSRANLVLQLATEHSEPVEPVEPPKPAPPPPQPPPGVYLPYVPYVPPAKPKPVEAPKPVPVDPLTAWYQKLIELHNNPTVRSGTRTFVDFDAQNVLVWVNKPARPSPQTPPIVVLCNLSSAPVQLSLTDAIKKLNLHGFYLRAVMRSDNGMGAQDLGAITLPPFAVYIGELRL